MGDLYKDPRNSYRAVIDLQRGTPLGPRAALSGRYN